MQAFSNKGLNVFPIAIGYTPPSFLERAIKVATKKLEHTTDEIFPQSTIPFVNITNPCNSDANLPLFGEIRRFFDLMGHFCELSRTDEKNLRVLGGSWATVNALSLFKG